MALVKTFVVFLFKKLSKKEQINFNSLLRYIFILLFCFLSMNARTSHIVGGEVYYDYLGNNQYKISVILFRDCFSTGAAYDDPLSLGIFINSGILVQNVQIPFSGSVNVPITFSNPCVVPPNNICIEKAVYIAIVNLPPVVGGYTLSYQRCCRGPNIMNLTSPDATGLTLTSHIPGSETGFTNNGSPRFTNYPPTILCNNEDLIFNHSATDPDGDVLVYSLVAPYAGATSALPQPNPPPAPPYSPVGWLNPFSTASPLGPGANVNIDPATGILTASPQLLGLFVVGIRVQEYRNGVLVGQTIRDFLFRVINCEITLQAIFPEQEDMDYFISYCQGLTVAFDNNSIGATNYLWDFGVTTSTTDISTQFEPSYTYPTPGTYEVMLIANPGWPCTDTIFQTVIVNEFLEMSYTVNDSVCISGNSLNFDGNSVGPTGVSYVWNFGPNASIPSSTSLDVSNVVFDTSGFIVVTLSGEKGTCLDEFIDSIYIFPMAVASFVAPPNYLCEGLTVGLTNTSIGGVNYLWDFGDPGISNDFSTAISPTYTFGAPGAYTVSLITSSNGDCVDTAYQTLILNEILDVSFTSNDSLCITGNSFDFNGSMVGSPTTTFSWNFGPNASPASSTILDVNNVSFSAAGMIPITLTGNYGQCTDVHTSTIFIYREPTIDFTKFPGLQCAPYLAKFINLSTADAPLNYKWEFGDEGLSAEQHPSHLYTVVGSYHVTLSIAADIGCTDTLSLTKNNFVVVNPSPTSSFSVTPSETDICHSAVQFTDLSMGAAEVKYLFGGSGFSNEANPLYSFLEDGTFYPMQIATNSFGCSDSSIQKVYIEPFMVYIPNAFTPDGDVFNNEFKAVVALEIVQWHFEVFNRWGQRIFTSTDVNQGWNGEYKGEVVQDGLYSYKLQYTSCEISNALHQVTGHFSLLR
jgi:gliding motility-associated-like protein